MRLTAIPASIEGKVWRTLVNPAQTWFDQSALTQLADGERDYDHGGMISTTSLRIHSGLTLLHSESIRTKKWSWNSSLVRRVEKGLKVLISPGTLAPEETARWAVSAEGRRTTVTRWSERMSEMKFCSSSLCEADLYWTLRTNTSSNPQHRSGARKLILRISHPDR